MPKKAKKKPVAGKASATPAVSKKVSKPKTSTKPAKAKSGSRGKRYTSEQKAKVLNYVNEVNSKKGRGGAAAASRKFDISQITIGQWIKKDGKPTVTKKSAAKSVVKGATRGRPKAVGNSIAATLRRLADIHEEISQTETQLAALQKEYASLKKGL